MNFINNFESFDEIHSEWEYIFRNNHNRDNIFFNFFDLKKIWWEIFQNNKKQLLIVANSEKSIIAPLIEENGLITFVGDKDLFDYQDFIFKQDISLEFLEDFLGYCFNNLNAKTIKFESIQEISPTLKILKELKINSELSMDLEKNTGGVILDFIGKEGVRNKCSVHNAKLARNLRTKKKTLHKKDRIFSYRTNNRY